MGIFSFLFKSKEENKKFKEMEEKAYLESKFTPRAREEAQKVLNEMGIKRFLNSDETGKFINNLDFKVGSLVNAYEDGEQINEELLDIYNLLIDITTDNEENLDYLNKLIFD